MGRFNQLHGQYNGAGLEIVGANYVNSDFEIQVFITNFSVQYGVARVQDDSGYTVPIFSTVFAIDENGDILWSGNSNDVMDAMVETWLGIDNNGGGDDDEACSSSTAQGWVWLLAILSVAVVWRRRNPDAVIRAEI